MITDRSCLIYCLCWTIIRRNKTWPLPSARFTIAVIWQTPSQEPDTTYFCWISLCRTSPVWSWHVKSAASTNPRTLFFLPHHPEYAVESYTVKATNYLMKADRAGALYETLDEIQKIREQEQGRSLVLKSSIGVHKIPLNQLMYVEAQGKKSPLLSGKRRTGHLHRPFFRCL